MFICELGQRCEAITWKLETRYDRITKYWNFTVAMQWLWRWNFQSTLNIDGDRAHWIREGFEKIKENGIFHYTRPSPNRSPFDILFGKFFLSNLKLKIIKILIWNPPSAPVVRVCLVWISELQHCYNQKTLSTQPDTHQQKLNCYISVSCWTDTLITSQGFSCNLISIFELWCWSFHDKLLFFFLLASATVLQHPTSLTRIIKEMIELYLVSPWQAFLT